MKLIMGVGFNSGGKHKTKEYGERLKTYEIWRDMIKRCYSKKRQARDPSYIGCSVAEEWHDYQVFAEWYNGHDYSDMNYQLDKDILVVGNKVYSPETCCLVPSEINSILTSCSRARGKYPQGVCWDKDKDRYKVQMNMNGRYKYLGSFSCVNEASNKYKTTKEAYVKERALHWRDRIAPEVFEALMDWELT